jgi:hypothetical protein
MATPPVDYAALADQARTQSAAKPVDYAALAAQARSSQPQVEPKPDFAPQAPQTAGHAFGQFFDSINPIPGIAAAISHPVDTAKGIWDAGIDEQNKGRDAWNRGEHLESAGHWLASAIPGIGPGAAHAGEQMGGEAPQLDKYGNVIESGKQPDIVGGLASGVGQVFNVAATKPIVRGVGKAVGATSRPFFKAGLHLPSKAEAFGANPAEMAATYTKGLRPETIAQSAESSLAPLRAEQTAELAGSNTPIDLYPARRIAGQARGVAERQGNALVHGQLEPLEESVYSNRVNGLDYPPEISPTQAVDIRRGIGSEFGKYGTPNTGGLLHPEVVNTSRQMYSDLTGQVHAAVPRVAEIDKIMQGLIPVKEAAEKLRTNPTLGQRVLNRLSRPTGGAVPAALGYGVGGVPGAAAGLALAEAASEPVPMIATGRGLYSLGKAIKSPISQEAARVAPFISGAQVQHNGRPAVIKSVNPDGTADIEYSDSGPDLASPGGR